MGFRPLTGINFNLGLAVKQFYQSKFPSPHGDKFTSKQEKMVNILKRVSVPSRG